MALHAQHRPDLMHSPTTKGEHCTVDGIKMDGEESVLGVKGIKLALKVFNEYYAKKDKAHATASGAGASNLRHLEAVESDFSKDLAEIEVTEEMAAAAYDKETKENAVEKTTKDKDAEYKTKEPVYAAYKSNEAVMEKGLKGIKPAL